MSLLALHRSICAHILLVLLVGCAIKKPMTSHTRTSEFYSARTFVAAVGERMPMWTTDSVSRFERVEIATVQADLAIAELASSDEEFIKDVKKLHTDWDTLVALDENLQKNSLI